MPTDRTLNFYLSPHKQEMAAAGKGIHGIIAQVVQEAGWALHLRDHLDTVIGPGYHLVENLAVLAPNCLTLRRCHMDPFYRIESTNDRWQWDVALGRSSRSQAPNGSGNTGRSGSSKGCRSRPAAIFSCPCKASCLAVFIFSPEPGRDDRSNPAGRSKAPDPGNPAPQGNLQPRGTGGPENFRKAVRSAGSTFAPAACGMRLCGDREFGDGFSGFFARKPAVLFAEIDFHHIAGSVPRQGLSERVSGGRPGTFASYLHWFLRDNAISAWSDDCARKGHRPVAQPWLAHMKRHPERGAS